MGDPFPPLATARLMLRCVRDEDAAVTSALMTPGVSRWLASWPVPFTPDMAAERIARARRAAEAGDALPLVAIRRDSGALIGWIMLNRLPEDAGRAVLGYWLGEAHHRLGFLGEAAPVVLAAGFSRLGISVIEAGVQPGNAASIAVLERCGMRAVGERMVAAPARGREELCWIYERAVSE